MTRDLTTGSPTKVILQFAIPVLFGLLLQQVYSLVDTAIVGHALGVMALGGVGSTGSLNFLVIGFCNGLCTGMAIPIAQAFGANNRKELRILTGNCIWLCVLVSAALLLLTLPSCHWMLRVTGTPEEQFSYAYSYIFIIFAGIPTTLLYNMSACILRALGDSKTPVWFLALASAINIALDLLFVYPLQMGVAGAAVATVISQAVSGLLCVLFMAKRFEILRMNADERRLRRPQAMRLLGMGLPVGLQFSITAVGSVLLQSSVNSLGAIPVSGAATAGKLFQLLACPYDTLAMAASNFAGQNLGAGKFDRIRRGVWTCMALGMIYCVTHILLVQFGCEYAVLLFMSREESGAVLPYTLQMCRIVSYFGPLLLGVNVFRLSIQGMGFSRLALFAGILEMIARVIMAVWGVPALGFTGACLAGPLAWVLADAFLVPACFACIRKRERQALDARKELATE